MFLLPMLKKENKKAKVLNCTDLTDEVAPGRPDPITFSR